MDPSFLNILPPPHLLNFFPNEECFNYWKSRHSELKSSDANQPPLEVKEEQQGTDTSDKKFGFFAKALIYVFLGNEHIIRNQVEKAHEFQDMFKALIGLPSINKLQHAASPQSDPEIQKSDARQSGKASAKVLMAKRYREYEDYVIKTYFASTPVSASNQDSKHSDLSTSDMEITLQFMTIHFLANECSLILLRTNAPRARKLREKVKFILWLCNDYIPKAPNKLFANLVSHTTGAVLLSCGMQRGTFEHWYLLKAFKCYETLIAYKRILADKQKKFKLVRRPDFEIEVCDFSIEGILRLAAIFIELRQTKKSRKLIIQALNLIDRLAATDETYQVYFSAYASYLKGMSYFEDTCPIISKINAGALVMDSNKLRNNYEKAKACLTDSIRRLTEVENYGSIPLTASAHALMGIVCVNEAADFTLGENGGLYYLEQAVNLEASLKTNTLMAVSLRQILQSGTTAASTRSAREKCVELHRALITSAGTSTVSEMTAKPSETTAGSACEGFFESISKAKQFTDGYERRSLDYWKNRLKDCPDDEILNKGVCLLFIARHCLLSHYLKKAKCRQLKVAHLCFAVFGLKLEKHETEKIDFEALCLDFPSNYRDLTFIATFWLVNEGMLALGNALEYYQQKSASEVVQRLNHRESLISKLTSWALYVSRTSDKKSEDWYKARQILCDARVLFSFLRKTVVKNEVSALTFLENYLAKAFYMLNDVVSFDDRYKTDLDLVRIIVDLVDDVRRLKHLDASLSDSGMEVLFQLLNGISVNFPVLFNRFLNMPPGRSSRDKSLIFRILELTPLLKTFDLIWDTSRASDKLIQLDEAYSLCQKHGLLDTEAHALVHMQAGIQLLRYGETNPFKPHYGSFNAAILKFRKAARIFELLDGDDVKLAHCYTILSVLYLSQMQVDEQQSRCLQCLEKCVSIERRLILKDSTPSPWFWKCLDVAHACREQFCKSEHYSWLSDENVSNPIEAEWTRIFKKLYALVSRETPLYRIPDDSAGSSHTLALLAEKLIDPLVDWEEKRNLSLKGVANMLRDLEFPEDSLPSDAEIRVYATYLNKLFSQHWDLCHNGRNQQCPLESLKIVRNDFLLGISEYSAQSVKEKTKIFALLQQNHNLLLTHCEPAQRFHDSYGRPH